MVMCLLSYEMEDSVLIQVLNMTRWHCILCTCSSDTVLETSVPKFGHHELTLWSVQVIDGGGRQMRRQLRHISKLCINRLAIHRNPQIPAKVSRPSPITGLLLPASVTTSIPPSDMIKASWSLVGAFT